MSENIIHVMVGGYLNRETALLDYQAVLDCDAPIEGAVCVTRDLEGVMTIEVTNRLDLDAPSAAGEGMTPSDRARTRSAFQKHARDTIPWGGAGLLAIYPHASTDAVDNVVTHALLKVVGEAEGSGMDAIKAALMDAHQQAVAKFGATG